MSASSAYQQMIAKVNTSYSLVESEVKAELKKHQDAYNKIKEQLHTIKDKHEVLLQLSDFFARKEDFEQNLESIRLKCFEKIQKKQFLFRVKSEKTLLLYGYLIKMQHIKETPLPTIIELNREYKIRKQKIVCEILSSFLNEEGGYEFYADILSDATHELERAIDLGTIEELGASIEKFQGIFKEIVANKKIALPLREKFSSYSKRIIDQMNEIQPIKFDEVVCKESLKVSYDKIKKERHADERELQKLFYQLSMLHHNKSTTVTELGKIRDELECLVFKETQQNRILKQLDEDYQALLFQREQFVNKPNITNYEQAIANLDIIEKRFKRLITEAKFGKPSIVERLFTINKGVIERTYIRKEKSNLRNILDDVMNNDNIPIEQKRELVRLTRESVLVNTHTGKFFFQRVGKTNTRQKIDEIDKHFNESSNFSLQH